MSAHTYAQIAYEAYAEHQGWKNYAGQRIPPWAHVRADIQEAWDAAAEAVLAAEQRTREEITMDLDPDVRREDPP